MQSLLESQRQFGAALVDPAIAAIMPRGFAVYVANVRGNWTRALAAAYPIVRKIVGEGFFEGLALEFARVHVSMSGDLNEFGARLPDFLAAYQETRDLPYLADVATMEWLAHCAYYAANPAPFDPARFAAIDPAEYSRLPVTRAPGSALYGSQWPLLRIWTVHQEGYAGEMSVDLRPGNDRFLIHRPKWRVELAPLAPGDYRFLAEAGHGAALGDALHAATREDPDFDPTSALARWVALGVVTL
ncbi:MAG: DNA-binding domain-containing protein [Betaproteobacteria bacterium]